jgi:hypothetical protein
MTSSLTFSLRPSDKKDRPFCTKISGTKITYYKLGKTISYFGTLTISAGPHNYFNKSLLINICFQVSFSCQHVKRRNDAFATWLSFTKVFMEQALLDRKQMNISSFVIWSPILHRDGSLNRDRFLIGTYGNDIFQDVVISTLFSPLPKDPSLVVINSQLYHFMASRPSAMPVVTIPIVNFGIEIQVIRCSLLTLDYVRDLLVVMGVPTTEIIDITYEDSSIIIYCLSIHAASFIMEMYLSYVIQPAEWSLMLRSKCKLRTLEEQRYIPISDLPPTGEYPGLVFPPDVSFNVITPVSLSSPKEAKSEEQKKEQTKVVSYGPSIAPILISKRPTPTCEGLPTAQKVSTAALMTMSSLSITDSTRGTKRNSRDMESQTWMDILAVGSLTDAQIELLISTLRLHVITSPSLLHQLEDLIATSVSIGQSMEIDGDLKS